MTTRQTSTNKYATAKWIVDATAAVGTHTTIAAALTAASSGDTIFIRPGTYTENLTLKAGVNLCAYDCDALTPNVTIVGKLTATFAGTCTISGICLQTNSDFFLVVSGSSATIINLINCFLNCSNNTGISHTTSSSSSIIYCDYCRGDIGTTGVTFFAQTSAGQLSIRFCNILNSGSSTTASTASAGSTYFQFSYIEIPFTNSGTNTFTARQIHMNTSGTNTRGLTIGGSAASVARTSTFTSGSASTISIGTTFKMSNCCVASTNTNAVIGAGELIYSALNFSDTGDGVTTSTQTTSSIGPRLLISGNCEILSGSGSPSGSITAPKGSLYLRTDGTSTSTRAYINTNSSTGWSAITTAS